MSAGAIKAGSAYVELFTRDGRLVSGLRAASARLRAFGAAVTGLGARFAGLGIAVGAGLAMAGRTWANIGSDLLDMSQRTGVAVEALSELTFAAEQSGATANDLEIALRNMSRTIGSGGMSLDQRLEQVADQLAAIQDPAARSAEAMRIFGRSGTMMLPMLMRGAAGLRELRAAAVGTWTTEEAQQAEAYGDALSSLGRAGRAVVATIGGALGPSLQQTAELLTTAAVHVRQWIDENRGLVRIIDIAAIALTGLGISLLILGPAISAVGFAFGVVATTISVVVAGIGLLLTPLGAIAAVLAGGVAAWATWSQAGQRAVSAVGDGLSGIGDTARTAFGGITDAIAAGDWELAMRIALAGVRMATIQAIAALRTAWQELADYVSDVWDQASTDIAQSLATLAAAFPINDISESVQQGQATPGLLGSAQSGLLGGTLQNVAQQAPAGVTPADVTAQLNQMNEEARRRREAQRALQAAQAAAQLAGDVAELQRLRAQAAEARRLADFNRMWEQAEFGGRAPRNIGEDVQAARARIDVAGAFSAAAIAGLGAGQTLTQRIAQAGERAANAGEQTARNTARIAQEQAGGLAVV